MQEATQPPAGTTCYVDASLIEQTGTLRTYFDGTIAAAEDTLYGWTGTANAPTSRQATIGAMTLPQTAYVAAKATGLYDQRSTCSTSGHPTRASSGRLWAGRGRAPGSASSALLATPTARATLRWLPRSPRPSSSVTCSKSRANLIQGTDPVVGNPRGGPRGFLDGRWSFTGAWTTQSGDNNFLYQTVVSGATATFTSDKVGSLVQLGYMNNGGPFTI